MKATRRGTSTRYIFGRVSMAEVERGIEVRVTILVDIGEGW